jgi:hypothetical protein
VWVDDVPVAPAELVLRHLGLGELDRGHLTAHERIELALEHVLRQAEILPASLRIRGAGGPGDRQLRSVLAARPPGEPPTESYAETRAHQRLRSWGLQTWRQMPILDRGRLVHRVDFVVVLGRIRRRPAQLLPSHGVLLEVDSREFHERSFERDHARGSTYDALGFHWVSVTPTQIERTPGQVLRALRGAAERMCGPRRLMIPRTSGRSGT